MIYKDKKPCYCSIGAGGKPCVSRSFCDKNKNKMWEANERTKHTGSSDTLKKGIR